MAKSEMPNKVTLANMRMSLTNAGSAIVKVELDLARAIGTEGDADARLIAAFNATVEAVNQVALASLQLQELITLALS